MSAGDQTLAQMKMHKEDISITDSYRLGTISGHIDMLDDKNLTNVISDGYHTFGDLYNHRRILTVVLAKAFNEYNKVYRSKQHSDDTMFDGDFIVVFNTPEGDYSYHYELEFWDDFDFLPERERADEWDGHKPEDITRLLSLI